MNTYQSHSGIFGYVLIPALLVITFIFSAQAQPRKKIDYLNLKKLPAGLTLKEDKPCRYEMITDYYNHGIIGGFLNKMEVRGIYTRGLDSGYVRWNDVTLGQASGEDQLFPDGNKQSVMENFSYIPSEHMIAAEPFKNFPPATGVFLKNLVWDVMGFEAFAWEYYDSLQVNVPYTAKKINGKLDLEGMGTFENKDIRLIWTGVSMMHDEPCAVIEFLAMNNPINFKTDFMEMKGRSHYWGTLWLSLTDKQIEHAVLYEDVNMDMKLGGQEKSQLLNTTREISFTKLP